MKLRWPLFWFVALLLGSSVFYAQQANTFHVFPQIADGTLQDGSYIFTNILVSRWDSGAVNCTVTPNGLAASRFSSTTFTMPVGIGSWRLDTLNNGPLASGYITLSCDRNVVANALYRYRNSEGLPVSMATVFSSQPAMSASIWAPTSNPPRFKIGLAVANDSTQTATYTITATSPDKTLTGKQFTLPPKTASAKFLDELFPAIPSGPTIVYISVNSSSPLYVLGLFFDGQVFTTIPPTVYF